MTEFRRSDADVADDSDVATSDTLNASPHGPLGTARTERLGVAAASDSNDERFEALLRRAVEESGPRRSGLVRLLRPGAALRGGRLPIIERLGEGGMGLVWKAMDTERGGVVALKTLTRLDPEGVYRLKHEFRALAEVNHPNLCRLYELFREEGEWFFTMELVEGERFDLWVRPGGVLDESRLRAALLQLCDGMIRIHEAGKLHRDLKPSNVLVTAQGRVVVLDFGLATDQLDGGVGATVADGVVSGTPAYMAPEQAAAEPATTASDLYALGVMLFEALTNSLPFQGTALQMYAAKQQLDPPRASSLAPEIASDLDALCGALLMRDPQHRPSAYLVRASLAAAMAGRDATPLSAPPTSAPAASLRPSADLVFPLMGREVELAQLHEAHAVAVAGQPVALFITGESGMGKSALISAFLAQRRATGDAVVLAGRCNERENVPFKAFDALVDDVSRYLRRLTREQALAILPREVFALARLFPALERVPVVAEAPAKTIDDPQELRRRAFAAFGELMGRIRDRQPLCIFIDDIQWIDQDSVLFMRSLLVDTEPAPVLLLLSHRSEGARENLRLQAIVDVTRANTAFRVQTLALSPLDNAAVRALALHTLVVATEDREALAVAIAREAAGSPFFVMALARHSSQSERPTLGLSLSEVLGAHLGALEPSARALLEVTALAGRPLAVELLLAASESSHDALDELRGRHFVRLGSHEKSKTLECYHDRIRETLAGELTEQNRSARYRALARVLIAHAGADPELLATCLEGSAQMQEAARYTAVAAARAEQGMAFDRAAELFRKALLLAPDSPERHAHKVALAEALTNSGRSKEAADAYLDAAADVEGIASIDLRRRAAEELLTGGYPAAGESLLRQVCREVGIRIPASHAAAMLGYSVMQARLRMRGLAPSSETRAPLTAAEQVRLGVARTAIRLTVDDPVFGLWGGTNYLLLALAAGDPVHCAYALAQEAANVVMVSPKSEKRIASIFAAAEHRTAESSVAARELQGQLAVFEGIGHSFGRALTAQRSRELLGRGIEMLQGVRGARWDVDLAHVYVMHLPARDLANEARRYSLLVEEAFSLGRLWAAGHMVGSSSGVRLAVGDVAGMMRHISQATQVWQIQSEMQWMDVSLLGATARLAHYCAQPHEALARVEATWPWYERSPLRRAVQGIVFMHASRGSLALSVARQPGTTAARRRALLDVVREDLRCTEKHAEQLMPNVALAFRVGLALVAADKTRASSELRAYLERPGRSQVLAGLDTLSAQRRLGQLLQTPQGDAMLAQAESDMKAMGVADVERTTTMLLPGCEID